MGWDDFPIVSAAPEAAGTKTSTEWDKFPLVEKPKFSPEVGRLVNQYPDRADEIMSAEPDSVRVLQQNPDRVDEVLNVDRWKKRVDNDLEYLLYHASDEELETMPDVMREDFEQLRAEARSPENMKRRAIQRAFDDAKMMRREAPRLFEQRRAEDRIAKAIPFLGAIKSAAELKGVRDSAVRIDEGDFTERDLLRVAHFVLDIEDNEERYKKGGVWEQAKDILNELPAFIGEFAATGGAFTVGRKAGRRAALKAIGSKTAARAAGVAAGAATQFAVNPQRIAQSTVRQAANRALANIGSDEKRPTDLLSNLPGGLADAYVEFLSERTGGALMKGLGAPLKRLGMAKLADKLKKTWIGRASGRTAAQFDDFYKRAGWHGIIGEIGEERVGELMRGVLGDMGVGDFDYGATGGLVAGGEDRERAIQQLKAEGVAFAAPGAPRTAATIGSAAAERLAQLKNVRSKGYVTEDDGRSYQIEGETRKERLKNTDEEIRQLEKEIPDAQTVRSDEAEVREEEGRQDVRRKGKKPVRPEQAGEVAPSREVPDVAPEEISDIAGRLNELASEDAFDETLERERKAQEVPIPPEVEEDIVPPSALERKREAEKKPLKDFIEHEGPAKAEVPFPGTEELYVRKGPYRFGGERFGDILQVARVATETPGTGQYRALHDFLVEQGKPFIVEAATPEFSKRLERMGYEADPDSAESARTWIFRPEPLQKRRGRKDEKQAAEGYRAYEQDDETRTSFRTTSDTGWVESLSDRERKALRDFTSAGTMERFAESERSEGSDWAEQVYSAMEKAPQYTGEARRLAIEGDQPLDLDQYTPGNVVTLPGATQFSADPEWIQKMHPKAGVSSDAKKRRLAIIVEESTSGRDVSAASAHAHEGQVVFPKGTQFEVVGVRDTTMNVGKLGGGRLDLPVTEVRLREAPDSPQTAPAEPTTPESPPTPGAQQGAAQEPERRKRRGRRMRPAVEADIAAKERATGGFAEPPKRRGRKDEAAPTVSPAAPRRTREDFQKMTKAQLAEFLGMEKGWKSTKKAALVDRAVGQESSSEVEAPPPKRRGRKKPKKRRRGKPSTPEGPETLLHAVRSLGGLSGKKVGRGEGVNIREDLSQFGLLSALQDRSGEKGGLDLEEMADELASHGYWRAPEGSNKGDALLAALKAGELTFEGNNQQAAEEYAAYQAELEQEQRDAEEEGLTREEVEEALRTGAQDGSLESLREAEATPDEASAVAEELEGDTSFNFGANVAPGIPGEQKTFFQAEEQGSLFSVSRQKKRGKKETQPLSELEKIEDELKESKQKPIPGQTVIEQAAAEALEDAKKEASEFAKKLRQKGLFANPFLDPELVAGVAKVAYKYAKAGVLNFAAFVERLASDIGQDSVDKIRPVLEAEWDKLQATGEFEGMEPFAQVSGEQTTEKPTLSSEQSGEQKRKTPEAPQRIDVTSIKNEMVAQAREKRGVEPLPEAVPETFEEWVEVASTRYSETGGAVGRSLVAELSESGRTISHIETAILQMHYRAVNNAFESAAADLFAARERGDEAATAIAQTATSNLMDELAMIEDATKKAGTAAGRALVSRRIELEKDFSLAAMTLKARVANGGKPLSKDQSAKIAEMSRQIESLQEQLKEAESSRADQERSRRVASEIAKTAKDVKASRPRKKSKRRQKAEAKVDSAWKEFESMAKGKLYANPFELTIPAAKLVAAYAELGVVSFAEFMAHVASKVGEENVENVRGVFREAWDKANAEGQITVPEIDHTNPAAVSRLAKQIERSVVEAGVTEREAVVDAVHESLLEILPDVISRRDTMDAMSGYGQFRPLSKDEIDKTIRDINGQLQQLAKLEDMEQGKAPAKTGFERREPSDEERRLIQQVNEAKKRGGFDVVDPERQLQTALNAAKTAVRNRIADMEHELRTGQRIVRERTELTPDAELEALRKQRDELREEHKKMFPPPGVTEEQKIESASRALDRAIEQLEAQIESGEVDFQEKKVPISTPELDAKRARLEELRAQRDALRVEKGLTEERNRKLYEASLKRRIADYRQRLAEGDFEAKPKKEPRKLSPEELKLKLELEEEKQKYFEALRDYRLANLKGWDKALDYARETAHLSRAVMTSADLSAVFRQGGTVVFGHPELARQAGIEMLKAAKSREGEFASLEKIRADPLGQFAESAGLSITEQEGKVTRQEEAFMGRWGKKFGLVRVSARAYTTFLNEARFLLFKQMVTNMGRGGAVTLDEAKVIAKFINVATGRSDLGKYNSAAANLNTVFFAPRYVTSRFQYLALPFQLPFMKTSGRVKKAIAMEYARHATGLASFIGLVVGLGALVADDDDDVPTVEIDPRSSDFGKLKIGETRIDPMSGLSQTTVFLARLGTGETKRVDGEIKPLRERLTLTQMLGGEQEEMSPLDRTVPGVMGRFAWSKLAPVPGAAVDVLAGENVVGEEVSPLGAASEMFIPLSFREVKDTMVSRGIAEGTAISTLAILGMGTATYGPRTQYLTGTKAERREQFEKDLKQMDWDSPELPYSEFLTESQRTKAAERRRERQAQAVYSGVAPEPDREDYQSDETYAEGVERYKSAQEDFRKLKEQVSHEEAQRLLLEHYQRDRPRGQFRKGTNTLKPGYLQRAVRIAEIYGERL